MPLKPTSSIAPSPQAQSANTTPAGNAVPIPAIVGGAVGGLLLIVGVIALSIYIWYRRKYPVRMVLGKDFQIFSNPAYNSKKMSQLKLVAEDPLAAYDVPPEQVNEGFVPDDDNDEPASDQPDGQIVIKLETDTAERGDDNNRENTGESERMHDENAPDNVESSPKRKKSKQAMLVVSDASDTVEVVNELESATSDQETVNSIRDNPADDEIESVSNSNSSMPEEGNDSSLENIPLPSSAEIGNAESTVNETGDDGQDIQIPTQFDNLSVASISEKEDTKGTDQDSVSCDSNDVPTENCIDHKEIKLETEPISAFDRESITNTEETDVTAMSSSFVVIGENDIQSTDEQLLVNETQDENKDGTGNFSTSTSGVSESITRGLSNGKNHNLDSKFTQEDSLTDPIATNQDDVTIIQPVEAKVNTEPLYPPETSSDERMGLQQDQMIEANSAEWCPVSDSENTENMQYTSSSFEIVENIEIVTNQQHGYSAGKTNDKSNETPTESSDDHDTNRLEAFNDSQQTKPKSKSLQLSTSLSLSEDNIFSNHNEQESAAISPIRETRRVLSTDDIVIEYSPPTPVVLPDDIILEPDESDIDNTYGSVPDIRVQRSYTFDFVPNATIGTDDKTLKRRSIDSYTNLTAILSDSFKSLIDKKDKTSEGDHDTSKPEETTAPEDLNDRLNRMDLKQFTVEDLSLTDTNVNSEITDRQDIRDNVNASDNVFALSTHKVIDGTDNGVAESTSEHSTIRENITDIDEFTESATGHSTLGEPIRDTYGTENVPGHSSLRESIKDIDETESEPEHSALKESIRDTDGTKGTSGHSTLRESSGDIQEYFEGKQERFTSTTAVETDETLLSFHMIESIDDYTENNDDAAKSATMKSDISKSSNETSSNVSGELEQHSDFTISTESSSSKSWEVVQDSTTDLNEPYGGAPMLTNQTEISDSNISSAPGNISSNPSLLKIDASDFNFDDDDDSTQSSGTSESIDLDDDSVEIIAEDESNA